MDGAGFFSAQRYTSVLQFAPPFSPFIYVIIGLMEGETDLTEFYRTAIISSMDTLALT